MSKLNKCGLTHNADELKILIAENPDLPIVVLASDDANCGDYCWQYCYSVSFGLDEILDCDYLDYFDGYLCSKVDLPEEFWKKYLFRGMYIPGSTVTTFPFLSSFSFRGERLGLSWISRPTLCPRE